MVNFRLGGIQFIFWQKTLCDFCQFFKIVRSIPVGGFWSFFWVFYSRKIPKNFGIFRLFSANFGMKFFGFLAEKSRFSRFFGFFLFLVLGKARSKAKISTKGEIFAKKSPFKGDFSALVKGGAGFHRFFLRIFADFRRKFAVFRGLPEEKRLFCRFGLGVVMRFSRKNARKLQFFGVVPTGFLVF